MEKFEIFTHLGKHHQTEFKKGHIPWSKGLTKESDDRLKKMSETKKGHIVTEEQRKKHSENAKINPNFGMKGKHHTDEARRKMSEAKIGKHPSEETKRKQSETKKRLFAEGKLVSFNKGKKRSAESRRKQSETRKRLKLKSNLGSYLGSGRGRLGKKHSEESKQKMRTTHLKNPLKYWLGKKRSEETKKKIRKTLTGRKNPEYSIKMKNLYVEGKYVPWNKGKPGVFKHSKETIEKMKLRRGEKHKPMSEQGRQNISLAHIGVVTWNKKKKGHLTTAQSLRLRKEYTTNKNITVRSIAKKFRVDNATIFNHLKDLPKRGHIMTDELKVRVAKGGKTASRIIWSEERKEETIRKLLKGLNKRPTSLEKKLIELTERNNLPYKYVGDGEFILGGKCPDFVNMNGEKICIEVRPRCMCKYWSKCTPEEYEQRRKEHFAKYGWECILIWADKHNKFELSENMIIEKLKEVKL